MICTRVQVPLQFAARQAKQVIGIEYVPEAIEDAKVNADINGIKNTLFCR